MISFSAKHQLRDRRTIERSSHSPLRKMWFIRSPKPELKDAYVFRKPIAENQPLSIHGTCRFS